MGDGVSRKIVFEIYWPLVWKLIQSNTQKCSSFLVDKLTLNINVKIGMCGINKTDKHAWIVISIIDNTFDFGHKLMIDHPIWEPVWIVCWPLPICWYYVWKRNCTFIFKRNYQDLKTFTLLRSIMYSSNCYFTRLNPKRTSPF